MSSKKPALCIDCGKRKKKLPAHRCSWCWLAKQPIDDQVMYAERRRARAEGKEGYEYRARVSEKEWKPGWRWCSGCQEQVPVEYARGSRCRAHASQASHASGTAAKYKRPDGQPFTERDYQTLLVAQEGRCYICQRKAVKRLAIDHSHATGAVRGLLCSSPDWGCNLKVVAILEGSTDPVGSARRLADYLAGDTPAMRHLA